jgi:gliding motility-associated-like protein
VANIAVSGTSIKWYDAASGGNLVATSTALINGTHYYASQTVNGCESISRIDVTAVLTQTPNVTTQTTSILTGTTFIVTPGGAGVPVGTTYTWTVPTYVGGVTGGSAQTIPQPGITGTLTIPSGAGTANYTVIPSYGGCTGDPFTVTVFVTSTCVPVTIDTQPTDKNMCVISGNASFTAGITGTSPFTYQWQFNNGGTWASVTNGTPAGASYSGSTAAALNVTGITQVLSFQYRCIITNCNGGVSVTSNTATLTVNALPTVIFGGTLTAQCTSSTTYALSGGSPAGGTYSGPGVAGTNFNASTAGAGTHTITYSYTNGCTNTATNTITVNALPTVTFAGTLTAQCVSSTTYLLSGGTPSGGTYSGPGVSGTNFNASVAGAGTHTITYSYTNLNGCTNTATNTIIVNALPIVTFGGTLAAQCVSSTTYALSGGSPSGGTYSGPGVTGTNFNANTAGAGTHTITYTYTNSNGCSNSASRTILVNAIPIPTLTSSDTDNIICAGTTITFTAGGGTNYNFRIGGVSVQNGSSSTYSTSSLTNSQVVDVVVTNTSTNGCIATSAGITNIVNQVPTGNASTGGDECDLDFIFNAIPSFGAGTWTKTTGPGTAIFTPGVYAPNATVTVSEYGTYTFTWTEVSNNCSKSSTITVNFYQQPVANAGTGGNNCGTDFTFNAVPGIGTGTWSKTSGLGTATFTPNANSPTAKVTVSLYGNYTFTWTEINGTCSNSASIDISFIQLPAPNAGTDGAECDLDHIMNASSVGTGAWSLVNGPGKAVFSPDQNQPGVKVTVDKFGTYDFSWTLTNGTCQTSDIVRVIFRDLPPVSAGRDTMVCKGSSISLNSVGTGTFSWTPAALVNNPNIANPIVTPVDPTYFTVSLTDQYGCINSDKVFVDVWDPPVVFAGPDTTLNYLLDMKMNGDKLKLHEEGLWKLVSGSGTLADDSDPETRITGLSIGENILLWTVTNGICPPSADYLTINVNDLVIPTLITPNGDSYNEYFVLRGIETLGKTEIIIFDRRGAQVYKNQNYRNDWNGLDYNGNKLPDDTYFFVIKSQNGKSLSGYIVIRR